MPTETTHPTAKQIIQNQNLSPTSLHSRVILITGCSSGIGIETARALALTGAKLFLGVRNIPKARSALSDIIDGDRVRLLHLDLARLDSVRNAAGEFQKQSSVLHILVNNGGVMMTPDEVRTEDGFEMQFGTNHLGHFLLFALLRRVMGRSVEVGLHCRVVGITSSAHRGAVLPLDDMSRLGLDQDGRYNGRLAYGQSKLANIYMMNEIERRYGMQGIHGLSVHPGGIFTGLQKYVGEAVMARLREPEVMRHMKSVEQGAATTVLAAVGREFEGVGGVYLEDCQESEPVRGEYRNVDPGFDVRIWDRESAEKLWSSSETMVGLQV
ncbi:short chain dehydrogenase [Aspergillus sclerotialis]|uniref:Short chain dehydrogenase n=1 Tax=Aspergillus sclerotialis TaxID=2070753 RepID=A0A3A2ZLU1_9EURO|nr:short chain dehydrogenase [Aspergillus sclerotialis]